MHSSSRAVKSARELGPLTRCSGNRALVRPGRPWLGSYLQMLPRQIIEIIRQASTDVPSCQSLKHPAHVLTRYQSSIVNIIIITPITHSLPNMLSFCHATNLLATDRSHLDVLTLSTDTAPDITHGAPLHSSESHIDSHKQLQSADD